MIYLDNNATTPCDPKIAESYQKIISDNSITNPHSQHIGGWKSHEIVEQAKYDISTIFNMLPDDVVFTSGATESNNLAILGLSQSAYLNHSSRNKIIVSSIEHKCVLNSALMANKLFGFDICICPVDSKGYINLNYLSEMIDDSVLLVSIMIVNNEVGSVQPFQEIGHLCKKFGVIFHADAAQAAYEEINMLESGIDMLSISGHKQYAPVGIGCLLIDEMMYLKPLPIIHGGNQQNGLRSGTVSPANSNALSLSITKTHQIRLDEKIYLQNLRLKFLNLLDKENIEYQINTPINFGLTHPGNLNISFLGYDNHEIVQRLQPHIACSTGSACNSGVIEQSYVLKAMKLDSNIINSAVRFCFGRFNTENDVNESSLRVIRILSH